jgi:purine-nucleoside phosphorylase
MSTPHNEAKKGYFAKTVLMPGDPLRAKYLAEHYLENVRQVNGVRGMLGFTGTYKGKEVSIMGSGMGMPSIGIYSYELYTEYDVENIIRVGSAGALRRDMKLGSVVAGMGACTDSNVASSLELGASFAPIADYQLLSTAVEQAKAMNVDMMVGNLYSSDLFYDPAGRAARMAKLGVLAVEMEAAGLYIEAARCRKRALAICSISDNTVTGEALDSDARVNTFNEMMIIALDTAVAMARNSN